MVRFMAASFHIRLPKSRGFQTRDGATLRRLPVSPLFGRLTCRHDSTKGRRNMGQQSRFEGALLHNTGLNRRRVNFPLIGRIGFLHSQWIRPSMEENYRQCISLP